MPYLRTVADRLDYYVDRSAGPEACWRWTGAHTSKGYGSCTNAEGRAASAHRLAYEAWVGPIPAGLELDHLCRTRDCVNPAHLEAVTHAVNISRAMNIFENSGTCAAGLHDMTDSTNIWVNGAGIRRCKPCNRAANRASYRRQKARKQVSA